MIQFQENASTEAQMKRLMEGWKDRRTDRPYFMGSRVKITIGHRIFSTELIKSLIVTLINSLKCMTVKNRQNP